MGLADILQRAKERVVQAVSITLNGWLTPNHLATMGCLLGLCIALCLATRGCAEHQCESADKRSSPH